MQEGAGMGLAEQVEIRCEHRADEEHVSSALRAAFGRTWESELVVQLRTTRELVMNLVAQHHGRVIGTAMFNEVVIEGERSKHAAVGLGPIGVMPGFQRRGVGTRLIQTGVELLKRLGHTRVVVVGEPKYFEKLGFKPASGYGIACDQAASSEDVLIAELTPHSFNGISGTALYPAAFTA